MIPRAAVALLLIAGWAACEPPFEPPLGTVQVTVATTGTDLDPDGYRISIDGDSAATVPVNGTVSLPVYGNNQHSVVLSGVAANCAIAGSPTRTVNATIGGITDIAYAVTCVQAIGVIRVASVTSGADLDTNGYLVSLDDGSDLPVPLNGAVDFPGLPAGAHTVQLSGTAPNCAVGPPNPRTVIVTHGATVGAAFAITCAAITGGVRITITTTGPDPDHDGYTVSFDGGPTLPVDSVSGIRTIIGLTPGLHSIDLGAVAANCTISSTNPATVNVVVGATAAVTFTVTCTVTTGSMRVTTTTTGVELDPNGYVVLVDSGVSQSVAANGAVTIPRLAPGAHTVSLSDVAANCEVSAPHPDTVQVVMGDTATATFAISCAPTTGTLRITTTTSGVDLDPNGYMVDVDQVCDYYYYNCYFVWSEAAAVNDTVTISGVPVGGHTVWLDDVAPNCTVSGQSPRTATVTPGDTVIVAYDVACAPAGALEIATATTGADLDGLYTLLIDGGSFTTISSNGVVTLGVLPEGDHTVTLGDIAGNCSVAGQNPRIVHVTAHDTVRTTFDVTCRSLYGMIRVAVATTGTDLDPNGYTAQADYVCDYYYYGCYYVWSAVLAVNDTIAFAPVLVGDHVVWLEGVAPNCTVTSPNPQVATVPPGDTATVAFQVNCVHQEVVVAYEASGYRFALTDSTTSGGGFEAPAYDDVAAGWDDGLAAFGNQAGCPLDNTVHTAWPAGTDILLRKSFVLPAGAGNGKVWVAIDNDVQVFMNGVDISGGMQRYGGCAARDNVVFMIPPGILQTGTNVLAVRARDRGGVSFIDLRVTTEP